MPYILGMLYGYAVISSFNGGRLAQLRSLSQRLGDVRARALHAKYEAN